MVKRVWRHGRLVLLSCLVLGLGLFASQTMFVRAAAIEGDANQDGKLSVEDLYFIIAHWEQAGGTSDLDGSGKVDILDLSLFLKFYASSTNPAPPVTPTPAPSQGEKAYGVAAGSSILELNEAELAKRLDGIKASGAEWIRVDFSWPSIQPQNAQTYQWEIYDRLVSASNARGLKILGILDYTPAWARPADCTWAAQCRPADPNQFARFAAATAERYGPQGVHSWEIWNEPNIGFWQPRADAAQYTALLKATSTAIRQKDTQSHIIVGGLSPSYTTSTTINPLEFLRAIYANGGKDSFDAVAMHPYTFPYQPTSSLPNPWKEMYSASPSMHSIMADNGDAAKKIWITEFGAPTGGPGPIATVDNPNYTSNPYVVDEDLQAAILDDALQQYKAADWAGPFFVYSYIDSGTSRSTNENFFGLVRYDGTFKPAYYTFQRATQATQ